MVLTRRAWLVLLAIFLAWPLIMAPFSAMAQQQYNSTDGFACNGQQRTCSTYALYRTYRADESLQTVGGYFNTNPATIANVSDMTRLATNAPLQQKQALYIPLQCSCQNGTSQMLVNHTIVFNDTFWWLSITIYGSLTKYQAMMNFNPTKDIYNLTLDDTIEVPIFCACPIAEQIANGTKFLLTYAVYPGETLDVISGYFNITTAQLSTANQLAPNATLEVNTTIIVPLVSLPPISTIKFLQSENSIVSQPTSRTTSEKIKVGISTGVVAVVLVASFFIARHRRRILFRKEAKLSLVDQINLDVQRVFTYKELSKATKNFHRGELLGSGGFGAVYKGILPSGTPVAVKRMRMESKHGQESFQAEVSSLSRIRHRNLVQLLGWCHEEDQLLLVYDYMCNGSLDEWLFPSSHLSNNQPLPLNLRHSILNGVAAALLYLHEECAQCVLHRDIKSSNVLLDGDWNAYLGDFGLARLIDHQKMEKTTVMAGTFGYMAPEIQHTMKATKESDVYSFGVLMLEVMCGVQTVDTAAIERGEGALVDRVWRAHEVGNILQVADSKLEALSPTGESSLRSFERFEVIQAEAPSTVMITYDLEHDVHQSAISTSQDGAIEEKKMIRNLLHLGLLCCNSNPEDRPSMRLVSQWLQFLESNTELSLPPLPIYEHQSQFSRSEFSNLDMPSSPWSSFSTVRNVQAAAQVPYHSRDSFSAGISSGVAAKNMQTSFADPNSSVILGR